MTARDFADLLTDLLHDHDTECDLVSVRTFEEVGLLTRDQGIVVRTDDDEFQVTIVRSC
jgi:hypothetical protein